MTVPFRVVIPARYESTRLPGKPLRPIGGRPMIQHVWERAQESGCSQVVVATDDERIRASVEAFGGRAVMTSSAHASGTDRLAEVATRLGFAHDDIVVNLQGDEPFVQGELLGALADALDAQSGCGIATLATPIGEAADMFNPNIVKVVTADDGRALYFSRAPIPWERGVFEAGGKASSSSAGSLGLRHLGLYAYRVSTLRQLSASEPGKLETLESLEQLRALALGIGIYVLTVGKAPAHGVDTLEDLQAAEREYARRRGENLP